jgi:antitoxin component of MazEF toxin-antitoxin module
MLKTLTPFGDELALVFDRALLQRVNINEDTKLDVSTNGEVIYIHPVRFARDDQVLRAVRNVMKTQAGGSLGLAEWPRRI